MDQPLEESCTAGAPLFWEGCWGIIWVKFGTPSEPPSLKVMLGSMLVTCWHRYIYIYICIYSVYVYIYICVCRQGSILETFPGCQLVVEMIPWVVYGEVSVAPLGRHAPWENSGNAVFPVISPDKEISTHSFPVVRSIFPSTLTMTIHQIHHHPRLISRDFLKLSRPNRFSRTGPPRCCCFQAPARFASPDRRSGRHLGRAAPWQRPKAGGQLVTMDSGAVFLWTFQEEVAYSGSLCRGWGVLWREIVGCIFWGGRCQYKTQLNWYFFGFWRANQQSGSRCWEDVDFCWWWWWWVAEWFVVLWHRGLGRLGASPRKWQLAQPKVQSHGR